MDHTYPYVRSLQVYDCPSRLLPWKHPQLGATEYWYPHYAYNGIIAGWSNGGIAAKMSAINGASAKILITHNMSWPYFYAFHDDFHDSGISTVRGGRYGAASQWANQRYADVFVHLQTSPTLFADGHAKTILANKVKYYTCAAEPGAVASAPPGTIPMKTTSGGGRFYMGSATTYASSDNRLTDADGLGRGCGFWTPQMTPPGGA